MTNRMLGIVIAIALTSGIAAHAAQAPQQPIAPVTLPATLQTAASHVSEAATSTVDPAGAIRAAYQRNRVALEHLRQQASPLKGTARAAFNQVVSDKELALTQTEREALATTRPDATGAIAAMDTLVAAAEAELSRELAQPSAPRPSNAKQSGQNQPKGKSEKTDDSRGNDN